MTTLITEEYCSATGDSSSYDVLRISSGANLAYVELKTVLAAITDAKIVGIFLSYSDARHAERLFVQRMLKAIRENPRVTLHALVKNKVVKTQASLYYLKLVAMRPLLRMQVLLRQKLTSRAPLTRLFLRNRARRIFATHLPVAPPQSA